MSAAVSTPHALVVRTALDGESWDENEGLGRVTFQVGRGERVSVIHSGAVHVVGERLIAKVAHMGGTRYRNGVKWGVRQ